MDKKGGKDAEEGDMVDMEPDHDEEEGEDGKMKKVKYDTFRVEGTFNCHPYTGAVNVPQDVSGVLKGPVAGAASR